MQIESVLILGVNGGFGKLFSRCLSTEGIHIWGADLQPDPAESAVCDQYLQSDLSNADEFILAVARQADCVLICLPESVALKALATLSAKLKPGALIADMLSVKSPVADSVALLRQDVQIISLAPMFAPDKGFKAQNVAIVNFSAGARAETLIDLLRKWGATVTLTSANEFDRQAALIQVAAHAAIISYGLCLVSLGYTLNESLPFSTPVHRTLLRLLERILTRNPEVYWKIQVDNPYAEQTRTILEQSLEQLSRMASDGNDAEFVSALRQCETHLAPVFKALEALDEAQASPKEDV